MADRRCCRDATPAIPRPISNLTFMSKIVERLVCRQLVTFLQKHNLLPTHQSAYRQKVKEIIVLIKARSFLDELNLEHLTS